MKVTVVTVCYNSEMTIERAIKSVIAQGYQNIEYIIIDGKSTDRTMEIVKKYADNISVIISEKDEGIYDAMNKGIKYASGDVVSFMNSDDWYEKGVISKAVDEFEKNNSEIVYGNYYYDDGDREIYRSQELITTDDIKSSIMICHQSMFFKRTLFSEIGLFNLEYKICADCDWVIRAINAGNRMSFINFPICHFAYGGLSTGNTMEKIKEVRSVSLNNLRESEREKFTEKIESIFSVRMKSLMFELEENEENLKIITEKIKNFTKYKELFFFGDSVNLSKLLKMCEKDNIKVSGIIDNSVFKQGKNIENILIYSCDVLKKEKCRILITSQRHFLDIEEQLEARYFKKDIDFIRYTDLI